MADEVWHEHYAGILSEGQIDYMVEKFQSPEAVRRQMKEEGYQYFLLRLGEETAGYCGIKVEEDRLFLSKLYLRQSCRGHGIARKVMEFLEDMCRRNLLRAIWLTVNKYNSGSIAAYEKMGFHKAYTQTTDIGSGYVMDDYIMEKPID
nr:MULTISPECIES: GNAT family N-acetyltransferase [Oscillospiraceae]